MLVKNAYSQAVAEVDDELGAKLLADPSGAWTENTPVKPKATRGRPPAAPKEA